MELSPLVAGRTVIPDEPPPLVYPTIAQVIEAVSSRYKISVTDIMSQRRHAPVARARAIAMWLCGRLTPHTKTTIGRRIGDRDHSSVFNAVWRIEEQRKADPDLYAGLAALEIIITRKVDGI